MCQVVPYTLPCCRKVYVSVTKLPSCPDDWPKSKCPAELCIQVYGEQPEHRAIGTCWRCKATALGYGDEQRMTLQPEIDTAFIIHGLEELDLPSRKSRALADGNCWYCGTKGNCKHYNSNETQQPVAQLTKHNNQPRKRLRNGLGPEKGRGIGKRAKLDHTNPRFITATYTSVYPDSCSGSVLHYPYLATDNSIMSEADDHSHIGRSNIMNGSSRRDHYLALLAQRPSLSPMAWNWNDIEPQGLQQLRETHNVCSALFENPIDTAPKIIMDPELDAAQIPSSLDLVSQTRHARSQD